MHCNSALAMYCPEYSYFTSCHIVLCFSTAETLAELLTNPGKLPFDAIDDKIHSNSIKFDVRVQYLPLNCGVGVD